MGGLMKFELSTPGVCIKFYASSMELPEPQYSNGADQFVVWGLLCGSPLPLKVSWSSPVSGHSNLCLSVIHMPHNSLAPSITPEHFFVLRGFWKWCLCYSCPRLLRWQCPKLEKTLVCSKAGNCQSPNIRSDQKMLPSIKTSLSASPPILLWE